MVWNKLIGRALPLKVCQLQAEGKTNCRIEMDGSKNDLWPLAMFSSKKEFDDGSSGLHAEVKVWRQRGYWRGLVRDVHPLNVEQPYLDLHGEECVQLLRRARAPHVAPKEGVEAVAPVVERLRVRGDLKIRMINIVWFLSIFLCL